MPQRVERGYRGCLHRCSRKLMFCFGATICVRRPWCRACVTRSSDCRVQKSTFRWLYFEVRAASAYPCPLTQQLLQLLSTQQNNPRRKQLALPPFSSVLVKYSTAVQISHGQRQQRRLSWYQQPPMYECFANMIVTWGHTCASCCAMFV